MMEAGFVEGIDRIGLIAYLLAVSAALGASSVSFWTIWLHLKNYRRPDLQRLTIRILLMIPVYAFSSLISLNNHYLAFFIDTIRDVYEAFVVYSFFILLVNYLDGERAILQLLQGRLRMHHLWPFNYIWPAIDMSSPDTFKKIQQGILQFVIFKPILACVIMALKLAGAYDEGYIAWSSSFLWLSLAYNLSVCIAMYWLLMFYFQLHNDLEPYRPMPKFICVKSIIFLTFWQGLIIAFLSWSGVLSERGEIYSKNNISQAYQDAILCLEMPLFAWMHWYAFPWTDYQDTRLSSRLQVYYAIRDCLGYQDIVYDTKHAFPNMFSFWKRGGRIALTDEEREPIARGGGNNHHSARYLLPQVQTLEFEIDPSEEQAYGQARNLVFGDFHYPVIHLDHRHPPEVQVVINKHASEFYNNLASSSNRSSLTGAVGRPLIPTRPLVWDDDEDHIEESDGLISQPTSSSYFSSSKTNKGKARA